MPTEQSVTRLEEGGYSLGEGRPSKYLAMTLAMDLVKENEGSRSVLRVLEKGLDEVLFRLIGARLGRSTKREKLDRLSLLWNWT